MIQLNYGVMLITRAEWGARRPTSTTSLTVNMDTNHWEGPHMGVFPHESCATKVRGIQNFHMDNRGWTDIAYNALACPHGYVFEGRGRGRRSAANGTNDGNSSSYATCYLGGLDDGFTEAGERAMKASGDWLTQVGSPRRCHRHWKSTQCPGDEICGWVVQGQPIDQPLQPTGEDDKMYAFVKGPDTPEWWLTDLMSKRHIRDSTEYNSFLYVLVASGATLFKGGAVDVWNQAYIDSIPTVDGDTMFMLSETYRLLTGHTGDRIGDLWEREGKILGQTTEILGAVTDTPT